MEPSGRCRCDECKGTEMVLQELDCAPAVIAKMEIMGAVAD
jgi:hypothetical protein